jgi:hypothetical protein
MTRLFSDLQDPTPERYFYSLATAPGGTHVDRAVLTINGLAPTVFEQVEVTRNPATATLTLNGQQLRSEVILAPAQAALSIVGQIPGEARELVVTNTLPPYYDAEQDLTPTVLILEYRTPAQAALSINYPQPNVTQGGNIGFISLGVGTLTLSGLAPTVIFSQIGTGALSVQGLAPTLGLQLVTEIGLGSITINGNELSVDLPFQWIDVDPPPSVTWTSAA